MDINANDVNLITSLTSAAILLISPVVASLVAWKITTASKHEDWAHAEHLAALQVPKLDEIVHTTNLTHALINSNYSTSLDAQMAGLTGQLWALRAVAQTDSHDASHAGTLIPGVEEHIGKLQAQIDDRAKAQVEAEAAAVKVAVAAAAPPQP